MNVLIIGGTGIISSEVSRLLLDKGNSVSIINRGRRKNMLDNRAKLIIADIRNDDISNLIGAYYDIVIDFISYDKQQLSKMLDYFSYRCSQFVFISSATVYKTKQNGIYSEDDATGNDEWDYSLKKSECETLLKTREMACKYTIVRPYVTYGKTRIPYQFCPLEYYTIINRIVTGKPIPIYRPQTKCTVTFSPEFAIGIVGLLMNEKAYNEAFHITCSYSTTWESIIKSLARSLNKEPVFINVTDEALNRNDYVFSVEEIRGDKSRDMVFDNSKIREAVPEFTGSIRFEDCAQMIVDYYENNSKEKIVNFRWDASIDKMLVRSCKSKNPHYYKLSLKGYDAIGLTSKNKKEYLAERYEIFSLLKKYLSKLKKKNGRR